MAASTAPMSTYKTFLMKSTDGSAYTKLVDIKDYSDLLGEPDTIEVTTLSQRMRTYVEGLLDNDNITFTCNYTKNDFTTCKALEGVVGHYAVWFGGTGEGDGLTPNGEDGKFKFDAYLSVGVPGKGVGDAREFTVILTPISEITFE